MTDTFVCKYRNSGIGGNDPQECAWPECGCDPAADRVLAHFQECGLTLVPENEIINLRASDARLQIILREIQRVNELNEWLESRLHDAVNVCYGGVTHDEIDSHTATRTVGASGFFQTDMPSLK